jgi:hypothetical protein
MPEFSKSSRNIKLNGSILSAECRTPTGEWQHCTLDLDHYLDNIFGVFKWGGRDFSRTAEDVRLKGTFLHARLGDANGGRPDASIDLDERIVNAQGYLEYSDKPIGFSHTSRNIVLDRSILRAECQTSAGEWEQSMVDLNQCLGNRFGVFDWSGKNFSYSAKDIHLDGATLRARLGDGSGYYPDASVDLNECIINRKGYLKVWRRPIGFYNTSRNVEIQGSILRAECRRSDNTWHASMIDLNNCLTNSFSQFRWGFKNFSLSAKDIRLEGSVLHARLGDAIGGYPAASVDLNQRIANEQGHLKYITKASELRNIGRYNGMLSETRTAVPDVVDEEARKKRDHAESAMQKDRRRIQTAAAHGKAQYKYTPLAKSSSMRLVKVLPAGEVPDIVECEIIEADLNSSPKFAALSYTWNSPFHSLSIQGDYKKTMTMRCNGRPFLVNQNLHDALRRLRHTRKDEIGTELEYELIEKTKDDALFEVENLLRQGVNMNVHDEHGRTAVHYAAELGHLDILKALVIAGGDIHYACKAGKTAMDYAKIAEEERCHLWMYVQDFLIQQQDEKHAVQGTNTCLRGDVTEIEYFWIDAVCFSTYLNEESVANHTTPRYASTKTMNVKSHPR